MNKKKSQLIKNTIIIFIGRTCTQFISYLLLPVYTSYLTKNDYGIVDLITTYITLIVPIITLELEMSIFRFLVDSRDDKKKTSKLISNNFYVLIISLFVFSLLYLIVSIIFNFNFKYLILFDIIVCVLSGNFLQVSRGLGSTIDYAISCIITGISTVLCNILFIVVFKMGAEGMILSMAISNMLCSVYLFIRLKLYKFINIKLVDKNLIKSMNKYSVPLIPNSISWWVVNASDRTIISYFLGSSLNGVYAISNKFPTILSSLLGIFNLSWSESSSLHINDKDREIFFSDVINDALKMFSSLCIGMIACMPFVFPLLINSKFNEAYVYIPILILSILFNVLICMYNGIYIGLKKTSKVSSITVIGAIVNIFINVIFINKIGLYAASISTLVSYFIMMIIRHFDIKKYIKIKLDYKIIFIICVLFSFTCVLYYKNDIILNIVNLIVAIIYAFIINMKLIKNVLVSLKNKFRK